MEWQGFRGGNSDALPKELRGGTLPTAAEIEARLTQLEDLDDFYALVCDLAAFEGKDLSTLPVTKAKDGRTRV